jgi:molybdopterin-guanine dinucleotide biosynthesis protein A
VELTGVVLAGGRSSRFGTDKAFARLGGCTLLERALAGVAAVCDDLVVVAAPGKDEASYAVAGARVTHDAVEGQGPVAGIVAGLRAARRSRALVVAVDMPCLREDVLRLLAAAAPEADVVAPVVDGRPEPLCAVYATRAAEPMAEALARDVRKITDAFAGLTVRWVEESALRALDPELRSFWNVNRPDDLARIRGALGVGKEPSGT